ncbi:MAG: 2-C-methyl-D-erythritol 4-phosphate cytidylyltransferase [Draconibacterium sp.]|nr:2-C-methyl-D-erythritol 4-phosphate cytidylyltransferase [Draconibacterium sp.]
MKKFALIVAGGSGSRMNETVPKQFIELKDRPILMRTFDAFYNYDSQIEFILVLPKNQVEYWDELCKKHNFNKKYKLVFGGETRFHSVKNGLDLIDEVGIVFIHDGVRPLVSVQTLQNCYTTTIEKGNALPVISVPESIRFVDNLENNAVDRLKYFLVQTPQTFKTEIIKSAFKQNYSDKFTDDASVLESFGVNINLVEGNRENIKITYPEDLIVAKSFLSSH